MRAKTAQWGKALLAAIVSGGANAGLSSLGIAAANLSGVKVQALNLRQLGSLCLSGAIIGMLAYLKQSPVPPSDGNTDIIIKPEIKQ